MRRPQPSLLPNVAALCCAALLSLAAQDAQAESNIGAKETIWERTDIETHRAALNRFSDAYMAFLTAHKTEREVVAEGAAMLRRDGFVRVQGTLDAAKKGDKIMWVERGKLLAAARIGRNPVTDGVRIIAAHIDSVRIDIKQNPLYEDANLALAQTHYYGGIKKYQWLSRPLELRGVVVLRDGRKVNVSVGAKPGEPVLVIPDLLAHLSREADSYEGEQVPGESLDPILGSIPDVEAEGEPSVRMYVLNIIRKKYGIEEADLRTAELQLVPAGAAVSVGLDNSMIGGYGHDDRACAYAALRAMVDGAVGDHTAIVLLVDKEEIGSTGNTGARSDFIARVVGDLLEANGYFNEQKLRRTLRRSMALSADVTSAANPLYPDLYDPRNTALLGAGPSLDQSGAHAEFLAWILKTLDRRDLSYQTGELSRVTGSKSDHGTILPYLTRYGMNGMDFALPLLSMHAPFEVISKADLYFTYLAYRAFLENG